MDISYHSSQVGGHQQHLQRGHLQAGQDGSLPKSPLSVVAKMPCLGVKFPIDHGMRVS